MSTDGWIGKLEKQGKAIPREAIELARAIQSFEADQDQESAALGLLQLADALEESGVDVFVLDHAREHATNTTRWSEGNSPWGCWVVKTIIRHYRQSLAQANERMVKQGNDLCENKKS